MFKLFKKTSLNSTPFFQGTRKDFHKYFGSFSRNLVQKITKSYKNSIGKCQHCEVSNVQLDAAHLIGKERKDIIDQILNNFEVDGIININLQEFENNFIEAHNPINKIIKILCKKCHLDYDNNNLKISENNIQKTTPTSYEASRLLFKKNIIELLDWDETFTVKIKDKNEEFILTKKQFYDTFDNVVNSDSYKLNGNYSYSKTPSKAYKFLKQNKSFTDIKENYTSFIIDENISIENQKLFNSLYILIFNEINARKLSYLCNSTKVAIRNNKIVFGNKLKSQKKENINLLFDYFVKSNEINVMKYDKDDWFSLISKLTKGKTKTIDYIYYRDFIQELLNRYKKI
jgi:hypothetical protein